MGFWERAKLLIMGRFALGRALGLVCRIALFGVASLYPGSLRAADLAKAEEMYKHTDFEASLRQLDKHSTDAAINFLIGRDYFMLVDFKKASEYLQLAVAEEPGNAEYLDWLGRAYGKRAETSNPLMAPGLASKARQAFQRAVELDPKNSDALSDLFDYYLEAPGFLGGGYDKAMAIAEITAKFDPAQGYFESAKLAQKRKEFQAAEDHLRKAISVAPREVGHFLALARFLATQGRNKESDAVFMEARTAHPDSPQVLFAWASVLVKEKRDLGQARTMLEKYMQASLTPDDPPKQEARRLLKEVGGA
jgi:tetratricopeptide (TPR) repeat protein